MTVDTRVAVSAVPSLSHPISLFHRFWAVTTIGVALITTVAWTALLGYGLIQLIEMAL